MDWLAGLLFTVLFSISILHVYWGLGGRWPGKDERTLVQTVIGADGNLGMPPVWITMAVALAILAASIFPLAWNEFVNLGLPPIILKIGLWILAIVFLGRGFVGYLAGFRKLTSEEPFATLNRKYFSPLCIVIGVGFVTLILA